MKPGGSSHKPEPDKLSFSTCAVRIRFKRKFSASTFVQREQAIARLKATEPVLRAEGVSALYLFGSHARGDANPHSELTCLSIPTPPSGSDFCPSCESIRQFGKPWVPMWRLDILRGMDWMIT